MSSASSIDFVLVWDSSSSENSSTPSATRVRVTFEDNLRKEGLQLSHYENGASTEFPHLHFICIQVPLDVLRCYSEILKLRLPMKQVTQLGFGAEHGIEEDFDFETESIQQQQQNQHTRDQRGKSSGCWTRFRKRYLELNSATIPSGSCHNIYDENSCSSPRLSAVYSRDHEYLFAIDELNEYAFFTPSIRHRIVDYILKRTHFSICTEEGEEQRSAETETDFGIEKLLKDGVYSAAYPLHDGSLDSPSSIRHLLYNEWAALSRCYKYQPLHIIKDYFGPKVGMYFAWLGFYTTMLIPIAILGLLCFLYGLVTMESNVHIADICGGVVVQEPMCPLCNKHCNYWNLRDTCVYAKLTHLFDNESTFLFSIIISLWTVIFLEYWKRYSATIVHQWDLGFTGGGGGGDASDQHPRAEYLRRLRHVKRKKINNVTRRTEPRLSFWRSKLPNMLLSMSVSWLLISLAIAAIMGVILYRISLKVLVLSEWTKSSYGLLVVNISAVMVNLIFILAFNHLYSYLAVYLTEIELHRTQSEFDDSLSLKIYLLQFVNFYSSIFYIAFFKGKFSGTPYKYREFLGFRNEECSPGGCMSELCIQLAIIMIGKQILNAIVEMSTPVLKKWAKIFSTEQIRTIESGTPAESTFYLSSTAKLSTTLKQNSILNPQNAHAQQQCFDDYKLLEWNSRSLFPEYLEMILQFGFITIFISAFPLGPLFALVNNVFELRLDGKKLLKYFRRPVSTPPRIVAGGSGGGGRGGDIGIWDTVLDTIAKLSVVSNAFIIGFTSDFIPKLIYRLEFGSLNGYLQYSLAYFDTAGFDERSRPDSRFELEDNEYINVTVCRYESFGKARPPDNDTAAGNGQPILDMETNLYWKVWLARFIFVVCFQNFVFSCLVLLEWIIPDVPKELADQIRQEQYLTNEIIIKHEVKKKKLSTKANAATVHSSSVAAPVDANADVPKHKQDEQLLEMTEIAIDDQDDVQQLQHMSRQTNANLQSLCKSNDSSSSEINTRL